MPVYVSDLFTATAAPVNATPTSTRTWQWLRGSSAISGATSATYTAVTADIGSTLSATQLETNFLATTTATSAATEVVQAFDPIRLFSASEPGVWYDPSDMSTLFQNATGTTPVTSFGQPVGLMLDKSRGLVLGPELVVNGTFDTNTAGWVGNSANATLTFQAGGTALFQNVADFAYVRSAAAIALPVGAYRVSFDVLARTNPAAAFHVGLGSSGNAVSAPGSYSYVWFSNGTAQEFQIRPNSVGVGTLLIDNISVKELPGLHATQSTDASRPLYGIVPVSGRRNLLTFSEDYSNAIWGKTSATVATNTATAPDGTATADLIQFTGAPGASQTVYGYDTRTGAHAVSFYVKANTAGGVGQTVRIDSTGAGASAVNITLTADWQRYSIAISPTGYFQYRVISASGNTATELLLWGAQLETGSTATAYQRVSTDLDVTEAGVASVGYLRFDGSTSWMVTPTITPGTDKVQVFAGVRKLSDAAVGLVAELSATAGTNAGSFVLSAPASVAANYFWGGRGSAAIVGITTANSYAAPITNVLAGIGDISGDLSSIRVNGVAAGQSTADQGTGDFLAYQMYIGRRGGTTLPFNGHLFPLIVRFGPNLTAARIAATEGWVATKTAGVVLP